MSSVEKYDIDWKVYYGNIKWLDVSDGPGVRVAIYVSGCSVGCEGCHNAVAWDYKYGERFTKDHMEKIITSLKGDVIEGFSILGGEPLDKRNREDVFAMIEFVRQEVPNKNIWLWTSYTIDQIIWQNIIPRSILEKIDVIVDGKFILAERDISLKFRGSKNQRVIDVQKYLKNEKDYILFQ
jgi:anaerobic ribonucleoside-triphosphate reductase activating protein